LGYDIFEGFVWIARVEAVGIRPQLAVFGQSRQGFDEVGAFQIMAGAVEFGIDPAKTVDPYVAEGVEEHGGAIAVQYGTGQRLGAPVDAVGGKVERRLPA
jgi:hypothetical protein